MRVGGIHEMQCSKGCSESLYVSYDEEIRCEEHDLPMTPKAMGCHSDARSIVDPLYREHYNLHLGQHVGGQLDAERKMSNMPSDNVERTMTHKEFLRSKMGWGDTDFQAHAEECSVRGIPPSRLPDLGFRTANEVPPRRLARMEWGERPRQHDPKKRDRGR